MIKDLEEFWRNHTLVNSIIGLLFVGVSIFLYNIPSDLGLLEILEFINRLNEVKDPTDKTVIINEITQLLKATDFDLLFTVIKFAPVFLFTTISITLLYLSIQYFIFKKSILNVYTKIKEVDSSVNSSNDDVLKTIKESNQFVMEKIRESHILSPDEHDSICARARIIEEAPDKHQYVTDKLYTHTYDILFANDYYSLILTKDYLEYFFYRPKKCKNPIRIVVIHKYCHGLLIFLSLCQLAGYKLKIIKKKDFLDIVNADDNLREILLGNPFFNVENDKIEEAKHMKFDGEGSEVAAEYYNTLLPKLKEFEKVAKDWTKLEITREQIKSFLKTDKNFTA